MSGSEVVWAGTITHCQLCNEPLGNVMYDAKIRGRGWANSCHRCFEIYGIGLGTGLGLGQKYVWNADRQRWIKVEG